MLVLIITSINNNAQSCIQIFYQIIQAVNLCQFGLIVGVNGQIDTLFILRRF